MSFAFALLGTPLLAETIKRVNVPRQPLQTAIAQLGEQANVEVVASAETLEGKISPSVRGDMTPINALEQMLSETDLTARAVAENSFVVSRDVVSQNAAGDSFDLGTLTLQARRFDEAEVDVPFSTSVISTNAVEVTPSTRLSEVINIAPNVNVSNPGAPRFSLFNIRGGGALNLDAPDDTSVGIYVDGVPIPRQAADFQLLDIEQVEILRGPQGTLFGDNSSAGVINIITRGAPEGPEAELRLSFDSEENYSAKFLVGMRFNDRVALRFAGGYNFRNGFIPEANLGGTVGELEDVTLRATLFAQFSETVSGEFVVDYNSFDTDHPSWVWRDAPGGPTAAQAQEDDSEQSSFGVSAKLTFDLEPFELQTITSFRSVEADIFTDNIDFLLDAGLAFAVPGSVFTTRNDETQDVFFQEFILRNETGTGLRWQAGLNYKRNDLDTTFTNNSTNPLVPGVIFVDSTNTNIESDFYAAFGEIDIPLSSPLTLSLGARYSFVDRSADVLFNGFGLAIPASASADFSGWSGRAALSYQASAENNYYLTLARGWKPGGFQRFQSNISTTRQVDPIFGETESYSIEIGNKRRFADGRGSLDVALFYSEAEDEQVIAFDFTTFTLQIQNADVRSQGFEVQSSYQITSRFFVGAGLGYTDAEFTSTNLVAGVVNGNRVPNVPKWSFGLTAGYVAPVQVFGSSADWRTDLTVVHRSSRAADLANALTLDDYTVVNLSTGIETDHWGARLFVRNLFDETFETSAIFNPNGRIGVVEGQERAVGLEISAKW